MSRHCEERFQRTMVDEYIRENDRSQHAERFKIYPDYIFDLGEHPVKSENKQRFRDAYPTTRPEYSDHAFNVKIDGKERKIRVPQKIAREIHLQIEAEAHPITFHQKLQPNYVAGQQIGPNKIGKMTVQNVNYYNSIQSTMLLPNYFRQKGWAIQNAVFDAQLKYRQVNGEDYPTIEDLDYSEEVAKRVLNAAEDNRRKNEKKDKKKAKARRKGKGKKDFDPRVPKLRKDRASYNRVIQALPHINEFVATDDEGEDLDHDMDDHDDEDEPETDPIDLTTENNRRGKSGKIKKHKLNKVSRRSTQNDERVGVVTRSAERLSKKGRTSTEGGSSRSDPGNRGLKRKQLSFENLPSEDDEDDETATPASFDLFASTSPKKDWDSHPDMKKLMKTGMTRMEDVGFSSPKPGSKQSVTMHAIARQYNLKLPRKRDDAMPILVRALAIVKIKQLDKTAVETYTDLKKDSSK